MQEVGCPRVMEIKCICGREVRLKLAGGQYRFRWVGWCECGCAWSLEELSESLEELD